MVSSRTDGVIYQVVTNICKHVNNQEMVDEEEEEPRSRFKTLTGDGGDGEWKY